MDGRDQGYDCARNVSFGLDLERMFWYTGYPHNAVGMHGAD
jgi:hypothetical protein